MGHRETATEHESQAEQCDSAPPPPSGFVSLCLNGDKKSTQPKIECEAGSTMRIGWQYDQARDTEFDFAKWDFLALHRKGTPHHEYDASRWLHGKNTGVASFTAPLQPGHYVLTAVRDFKYVLAVMSSVMPFKTRLTRIEQYRQRVDESQDEDLQPIGSISLVVLPSENPPLQEIPRPILPGKTG